DTLRAANQEIVVAAQDIPPGTIFNEETMKKGLTKTTPWPKTSIPAGAFSSQQQIVGKVNRVKILANEPILESRLAGEGAGLTVRLEAGKRALALRVDEIVGVSGFIVPDDRVDIILTTTPQGAAGDVKISKIVLQNKRVLSVAQSTEQKDGKPQLARSITLEVTPEEAEKLSLASQEGQIVLALRGLGDDATTMTIGSNKRDLLALAAAPRKVGGGSVAQPPPPDKYRVEVIHGSNRNVVEF
ncbi:MAG TPA: Flp pilus assembly protein CpaB, partial [Candidatus Limnocylindrales bacterium]|nr:Flp pilus assembly protein CpaB [Candidatus Limnocylindrales bacterium]